MKISVYMGNKYWNSNSYGSFSTMDETFALLTPLKQSTMDFLNEPEVGNCWHNHSTNLSKSCAKSCMFLSNSSGSPIFFALVTIIEACKYSSFALSNSFTTPSLVYTLTAGEERVPQHNANVTFGSIDSSP